MQQIGSVDSTAALNLCHRLPYPLLAALPLRLSNAALRRLRSTLPTCLCFSQNLDLDKPGHPAFAHGFGGLSGIYALTSLIPRIPHTDILITETSAESFTSALGGI